MLSTLSVSAAAPGNRVFYGFNLGSAEWADGAGKTYDCGFVSYPFDLSEKGTVLHSYLFSPNTGAYAGGGKDGIIYVALYDYTTSTQQPTATDLVAYNTYNGTIESIGKWNPDQTNFKPQDMTYDAVSGKMYSLGFENGVSGLYEVDLTNATFTHLCDLQGGGGTLAADAKGVLWTLDSSGILYSINTNDQGKFNGRVTKVYETGLSGMLFNQSMEFDHTTGLLYWASGTQGHKLGGENVYLQEIDLSNLDNIKMREVGRIGISSRFVGMWIPSAESLDAPAAPTDIRSESGADGALQAKLTWVNPTTAFGGGEIGNLYGVAIYRDGERVDYLDSPVAGKEMSWTDTDIPAAGYYHYEIQVVNGRGNGAKGIAYQYVGLDRPAAVTEIAGTVGSDMKSVTLTWKAPTTGARLGSFDPTQTKYTVTRNDGIVIAKDITECTVSDNTFRRLMAYTYTITASNSEGGSDAVSQAYILGPALELPLEQTFENEAEMRNRWTILDGNNDTYTWMFYTNLGHSVFGDYEVCAEYIVSPTLGNTEDADEWLISPPVALEAGVEYEVTISSRCYSVDANSNYAEEPMDIYFGKMNTREAMTEKLGTIKATVNEIDDATGTMAFKLNSVALPVQDEDATRCVGINMVTPLLRSGFLQINAIYIAEKGVYNGVNDIATDAAQATIALNGRTLTIFGDFKAATLYNIQGAAVATATSAIMNLDSLANGVYILNVDGRSFKIAL